MSFHGNWSQHRWFQQRANQSREQIQEGLERTRVREPQRTKAFGRCHEQKL